MALFDRTPFERFALDIKYFWETTIIKKPREERFKELFKNCRENDIIEECGVQINHCQYWHTNQKMQNKYKKISKENLDIHSLQLKYGKFIYEKFENDYCTNYHKDWCIYENQEEELRRGIIKIGRTLHALCHAPVELIQYRMVGLNLSYERIFEKLEKAKKEKNVNVEKELLEKGKYILHKEQFMQHYFEVISLKNTISDEIKLEEKQSSTLTGWMGFFVSLIITLWLSSLTVNIQDSLFTIGSITIGFNIFSILFAFTIFLLLTIMIWYIWVSIKLNEAKDVMYICLGVDVDNPKSLTSQI